MCQISLETERLGPRRVEGLKKEDEEWQKKAHAAVLAIQDLTVRFFEATTRAQKGNCAPRACLSRTGLCGASVIPLGHHPIYVSALYERMRADQKKFGKSSWAAAVERMERLQYAVSKETLQLMRAKEICLEQKKHALKEEVRRAGHSQTPVLTFWLYGRAGSQRDTRKNDLCERLKRETIKPV